MSLVENAEICSVTLSTHLGQININAKMSTKLLDITWAEQFGEMTVICLEDVAIPVEFAI